MLKFLEKNKVILVYIPLGLYWLLILFLTTYPTDKLPSIGFSDKINHVLAYFGLAVLLNLTLQFQKRFPRLNNAASLYTIIIVSIYGLFDELHQYFIPGRSCSIEDWAADLIGGIIGLAVVVILRKIEPVFNKV